MIWNSFHKFDKMILLPHDLPWYDIWGLAMIWNSYHMSHNQGEYFFNGKRYAISDRVLKQMICHKNHIYVYDCRSLTHKCLMRHVVWDRLLLKMIFHKTYIYDLFWLPYGILRYVFSGNFLFGIIYHHRIHNFSLYEHYWYAFLGEILCQIFLCRCHTQIMFLPQPFWKSNYITWKSATCARKTSN